MSIKDNYNNSSNAFNHKMNKPKKDNNNIQTQTKTKQVSKIFFIGLVLTIVPTMFLSSNSLLSNGGNNIEQLHMELLRYLNQMIITP